MVSKIKQSELKQNNYPISCKSNIASKMHGQGLRRVQKALFNIEIGSFPFYCGQKMEMLACEQFLEVHTLRQQSRHTKVPLENKQKGAKQQTRCQQRETKLLS